MITHIINTEMLSELLEDTPLTINVVPFNIHNDNHSTLDLSDESLTFKTRDDLKLTNRKYEEISQTTRESFDDINPLDNFESIAKHYAKRLVMSHCEKGKRYKMTEPIVRMAYDHARNFQVVTQVSFRILEV